jgi:hypothetical protein
MLSEWCLGEAAERFPLNAEDACRVWPTCARTFARRLIVALTGCDAHWHAPSGSVIKTGPDNGRISKAGFRAMGSETEAGHRSGVHTASALVLKQIKRGGARTRSC